MYQLYIVFSESINKYSIGYTNNLERRLKEHNRIKGKFTDRGIPWKLKYCETFETAREVKNRESFIKSRKSRTFIKSLIKKSQ